MRSQRTLRVPWLVFFAAAALAQPACRRGSKPDAQPKPLGRNGLEDLAQIYKYRSQQGLDPPRRLQDLDEHEPAIPTAYGAIAANEYVVNWGVGLSNAGDAAQTVLAYEKNAPTSGGLVLTRDGAVRQMTPAEFNALRRPN